HNPMEQTTEDDLPKSVCIQCWAVNFICDITYVWHRFPFVFQLRKMKFRSFFCCFGGGKPVSGQQLTTDKGETLEISSQTEPFCQQDSYNVADFQPKMPVF